MEDMVGCFGWLVVAGVILMVVLTVIIYVILPFLAICVTIGMLIGLWCTGRNYIAVIRETFFKTGVQNEE